MSYRAAPPDEDRCKWDDVQHAGQLFGVRCLRPRRRGYLWCWQHTDKGEAWLKAHAMQRPT